MIKLKLENAINESTLKGYSSQVKDISSKMHKRSLEGSDFLGWIDLPKTFSKDLLKKIEAVPKKLENLGVDALVVIGIGGSFSGAKAAIDMINGLYPQNKIEIIYLGNSVSSNDFAQRLNYLQDKKFAINIISKSGTTTEPAIAFRLAKAMLEKKVGKSNAHQYIFATTDANKGSLLTLAQEEGYETFVIPDDVGGRFSVLTPVGLLPIACAGISIKDILKGAHKASKKYCSDDLLANDAYKYAVARYELNKEYPIELMVQYESQLQAFSEWWKQLAGESEGKNSKGVFPASAIFSTDLHSLGQFIQEGSKVMFETMISVKKPQVDLSINIDERNLDGLNYLSDKTVHFVNNAVYQATVDAHHNVGKVPVIEIELEEMSAQSFGYMVIFFEYAIAMTAYLLGVNPFNQPGVEIYKQNMFKVLGKN